MKEQQAPDMQTLRLDEDPCNDSDADGDDKAAKPHQPASTETELIALIFSFGTLDALDKYT